MLGIEKLKTALAFALNLTEEIQKAGQDGFTWTDAFGFVDDILKVPGLIASGDQILAELKDLTMEEKEELAAYLAAEFDIPNDRVEAMVEDALKLALTVVALVNQWKELKAA